jgi:hypothetical protein
MLSITLPLIATDDVDPEWLFEGTVRISWSKFAPKCSHARRREFPPFVKRRETRA